MIILCAIWLAAGSTVQFTMDRTGQEYRINYVKRENNNYYDLTIHLFSYIRTSGHCAMRGRLLLWIENVLSTDKLLACVWYAIIPHGHIIPYLNWINWMYAPEVYRSRTRSLEPENTLESTYAFIHPEGHLGKANHAIQADTLNLQQ